MKQLALALVFSTLATPADHQRPDPEDCSVCRSKPAKMKQLNVESHGDFRFARTDSKMVESVFNSIDVYWIEGKHVKLGFSDVTFMLWPTGSTPPSGPTNGPVQGDTRSMRSLATGALSFDPYARVHAYLERAEDLYVRMQEVLQVEDEDFPAVNEFGLTIPFEDKNHPYMGAGPYLGQKAKYELLFMPGPVESEAYTKSRDGLDSGGSSITMIKETDAMSLGLHLMDGTMWDDDGVWGYMIHNLSHAYLSGYKHNSYPTPVWIQEGLAHALEREHSPHYTSYCAGPEVYKEGAGVNDWTSKLNSILRKRKKPYLEPLLQKTTAFQLTFDEHVMAWSMVSFLLDKYPDEFAAINADLHSIGEGRRTVGMPQINIAQLDSFDKHLGMTYEKFDKAWAKWAKKQKARK
jgi:hypothetical protein